MKKKIYKENCKSYTLNTLFSGEVQKYFELLLPRNKSVAINRLNFNSGMSGCLIVYDVSWKLDQYSDNPKRSSNMVHNKLLNKEIL